MEKENRFQFLDIYRGVMILWILIVHVSLNFHYIKYGEPNGHLNLFTLLSFYMFTFYFSAGYLFKLGRNFEEMLCRKTRTLVVPWILYTIWGIIVYFFYCLVVGKEFKVGFSGIVHSWSLVCNTPMWFLGSLFCSTILLWFIINKTKGIIHLLIAIILLFVIVKIPNRHFIFGIENIFLGTLVMLVGYYYRIQEHNNSFFNIFFYLAGFLFFTIWLLFPCEYWFDRNIIGQGTSFCSVVYGLLGSYLLFNVSKYADRNNFFFNSLSFIGRNSLILFAFHRPVLNYIIDPLLHYFIPNISYLVFLILSLFFIILFYLVFWKVAKKYCKILL